MLPLQVMRHETMPAAYEHAALMNRDYKVLEVEAAEGGDDAGEEEGGDDY